MNGSILILLFISCLNGWLDIYSSSLINKNISNIISGGEVGEVELPFIVSLQRNDGTHVCGGTIISWYSVLTAAHCFIYKPTKVVAGVLNFQVFRYERQDRNILFSSLRIHPQFKSGGMLYDIAVFRVSFTFYSSFYVHPVEFNNLKIFNGKVVGLVAGWGQTNENDPTSYSPTLLSTKLQILSPKTCSNEYGDDVRQGLICALPLHEHEDACQGDSGGPLLYKGKLVGIISTGQGCGRIDTPDVYTNVSYFSHWIQNNV